MPLTFGIAMSQGRQFGELVGCHRWIHGRSCDHRLHDLVLRDGQKDFKLHQRNVSDQLLIYGRCPSFLSFRLDNNRFMIKKTKLAIEWVPKKFCLKVLGLDTSIFMEFLFSSMSTTGNWQEDISYLGNLREK